MPASWIRRRSAFENTAPNARSDSVTPRSAPTLPRIAAFLANVKIGWEDFASVPRLGGDSAEGTRRASDKEGQMSEDESRIAGNEEETDEVEGHRKGGGMAVNDESTEELRREGEDDDVEAHSRNRIV